MDIKFIKILSEVLEIDANKINSELELDEEIWSSISIISFIDEIYQEYDIELDGESLEEIKTVKDLEDFTFNAQ
tara:strand:+ start:531 stop:752 length:222 start_codon:yes stop_codon:yes gene_type:complete